MSLAFWKSAGSSTGWHSGPFTCGHTGLHGPPPCPFLLLCLALDITLPPALQSPQGHSPRPQLASDWTLSGPSGFFSLCFNLQPAMCQPRYPAPGLGVGQVAGCHPHTSPPQAILVSEPSLQAHSSQHPFLSPIASSPFSSGTQILGREGILKLASELLASTPGLRQVMQMCGISVSLSV